MFPTPMKSSSKINFPILTGSIFLMLDVFAKPLGIPSDFEIILLLVAIGFICLGYRGIRKAKKDERIPTLSGSQKRKKFVLLAACSGAACVAYPFMAPSLGVSLPFDEAIVISVISFVFCMGCIWFGLKKA